MRRLLAALVTLACSATLLAAPPGADAGPPGRWTTVTGAPADLGIIMRPGTVRTADGLLHVVYGRKDATSSYSIRHVALTDTGATRYASTVVSDWDTLTRDPRIVSTPTGLRVVFSGLRNGDTFDPYTSGAVSYATSDGTGAAWTLQSTYLSDSTSAYADYGLGAVTMSDGSTFVAWALNNVVRYADKVVADPRAPEEDASFSLSGGTSVYDVEVARVPGTDQVWLSWFALSSTTPGERGVFVRQVSPALGPIRRAPQSVTRYAGTDYATQFSSAPALVARSSGPVIAYPVGYPNRTRIAVWRVGAPSVTYLPASPDGRLVDLSVGAGDRLWAAWASGQTVRASRSNPAGTAWGAPVALGSVRVDGNPSTWSVDVAADGGPADVVVGTSRQLVHQRVLPGLTLGASPRSWDGDRRRRVQFRATDAGAPVGGVVVLARGQRCTTNATGTCRIRFGRSGPRRFTATAVRAGYTKAAAGLRVLQ
ncbi:hypothetical protein ABFT23_21390 [Nocardioides sp. C4-1]|uniref:hypothetical protein n=1 Tax=Nocardioides sp. C4-1 TaxID=3151851 RepID=UPI0032678165